MNITATANADGTVDLTGKQGCTWSLIINVFTDDDKKIPMVLTDYLVRGQIKAAYGDADPVAAFEGAVTDAEAGEVTVTAAASVTASIPYVVTRKGVPVPYVYDIEIHTGTPETVTRILQGKLTIDPEVTTS
jgi:hypothetical protein